jgi:phage-related protein
MDPCYNAIVRRINALAEVNGEADYISFINQLNGVIEDMKTTLTVQQTARNKRAQQSTIKVE